MSVTPDDSVDDEQLYDCGQCDGEAPIAELVAGSFCSMACYQDHRREKRTREVFRELEQDHKFCGTCFRKLKEIERPTNDALRRISGYHSQTCVAGYQYRTKHARSGEKSIDVDVEFDPTRAPYRDAVATGTICVCGNTDHRHNENAIRDRWRFLTGHYLTVAVDELRRAGKHDVEYSRDELFEALLDDCGARAAFRESVIVAD